MEYNFKHICLSRDSKHIQRDEVEYVLTGALRSEAKEL